MAFSPDVPALVRTTLETLDQAGFTALLAGGCVRDFLLGRPPKDFDVATDATPAEILKLFPHSEPIGVHFGVVLVKDAASAVEVATFRSEGGYSDGRRPDAVRFETSPELDAQRRDFTINGLFYDLRRDEVLDYVGGQADLRAGIMRAIGDPALRFGEDYLRMLRAVRFAARFSFTIDTATMSAARQFAGRIERIAAERVRDELSRILIEGGARAGMQLLDEMGLLAVLLPEVKAMQGVEQPPEYHPEGDVWTHTLAMLELMGAAPITLAWSVLLHDVGKPPTFRVAERIRFDGHDALGAEMARAMLTRLRYPVALVEEVVALVAGHMRFLHVRAMRPSTLKRFLRRPDMASLQQLHRLDCASSHGRLENYHFIEERLAEFEPGELHPPKLINGRDLIALGFEPGREFGELLQEVETAQLEGTIATREEALAYAAGRKRSADSLTQ